MRILVLTNFFPPARSGGYTQWCHEVSGGLSRRGHEIGVLTSCYKRGNAPPNEQDIYRLLHLEGDLDYYSPLDFFLKWKKQHRKNLIYLDQTVREFEPDLVFIWGMWALSKALPALAERLAPGRVVYYLSDYWLSDLDMHTLYWQSPTCHTLMQLPKRVLSNFALARLAKESQTELSLENVICVSAAVRDNLCEAGLPVQHARIIYGGTDKKRFPHIHKRDFSNQTFKLLYAGQLVQHKGVHTAIEALSWLVHKRGIDQITLTLVGSGHPEYEAFLRELVKREHLQGFVTFHNLILKDEMPAFLQGFDVLVFPSIYQEPLARIVQEAMFSGLVVVGTNTGGTKEILQHGENGLIFPPEDAERLADQIERLRTDPDLYDRLAQSGCETVLARFTLDRMVDEIEAYLLKCYAGMRDQITGAELAYQ